MVTLDNRLISNEAEVAAKVIGGEAIMINLSNSRCYSMDGVGAFVWSLIEGSHSLAEIAEALTKRYDVTSEQAQADVERLAIELLEEELVKIAETKAPSPGTIPPVPQKFPYEPPRLNILRDMDDLLALDPPIPGLREIPWDGPKSTST